MFLWVYILRRYHQMKSAATFVYIYKLNIRIVKRFLWIEIFYHYKWPSSTFIYQDCSKNSYWHLLKNHPISILEIWIIIEKNIAKSIIDLNTSDSNCSEFTRRKSCKLFKRHVRITHEFGSDLWHKARYLGLSYIYLLLQTFRLRRIQSRWFPQTVGIP